MNRRQFIISSLVAGSSAYITQTRLGSLEKWTQVSPLRVGIIGLGQRGLLRFAECGASDNVQLQGLCDIDNTALDLTREELVKTSSIDDVLSTCQAREIFTNPEIDAVSIAVPVAQRADLVKQACNACKHVLVEAPWAATNQESEQVARIASESGLVVQQASYDPDWNDEHFSMYVAGSKKDLKAVHLNILIGAEDDYQSVLHPAFDLLGATDRWLNVGNAANVGVVADQLSRCATVRIDYQGEQRMVFTISRTSSLAPGQMRADVESWTTTGDRERFVISTSNLDEFNDSRMASTMDCFAELASSHRLPHSAADTHARNCFIHMLNQAVESEARRLGQSS